MASSRLVRWATMPPWRAFRKAQTALQLLQTGSLPRSPTRRLTRCEELIFSTEVMVGAESNILEPTPQSCHQIRLEFPLLKNEDMAKIYHSKIPGFAVMKLPILFPAKGSGGGPGWSRRWKNSSRPPVGHCAQLQPAGAFETDMDQRAASPSLRCWRWPGCITTWCGRASARRSG